MRTSRVEATKALYRLLYGQSRRATDQPHGVEEEFWQPPPGGLTVTAPPSFTGRLLVEDLVNSAAAYVPPGGTYQATCSPRTEIRVSEILVHDFTLVELYFDNYFVKTQESAASNGSAAYNGTRTYCLGPWASRRESGPVVRSTNRVRVVLKNETDQALRAREANFEEAH